MPRCQCRNHRDKIEGVHRCKIFEIGIGRCGTRSICVAVESLGIEVIHGFGRCGECSRHDIEKYLRHECDFGIYKTCNYSSNIASVHWRQLIEAYPEAKFVLAIRPIDAWLHKWENSPIVGNNYIKEFFDNKVHWGHINRLHHFGMIAYDRDIWKNAYEKHNEDILNTINPERLLVLNVFEMSDEELWNKLALFLDCKVPSPIESFPKSVRIFRHKG